jgi:hypothetical protein
MPDKRSYVAVLGKGLNGTYNELYKLDPSGKPALELLIQDLIGDVTRELRYEIDAKYKEAPHQGKIAFLHVLGRRLKTLAHNPEYHDAADDEIDKVLGLMDERDEEYRKREPLVYDLGLVGKDRDEIEKLNCGVREAFGDFYKKLFSDHTHSAYTFKETDLGPGSAVPPQLEFECVDCGDAFHVSLNHGEFDSYVPLLEPKERSMIDLAYMVWLKDESKKHEDKIKGIEDGTIYLFPGRRDDVLSTSRYALNTNRERLEEMQSRESNIRISE